MRGEKDNEAQPATTDPETWIWRGTVSVRWRPDCYGRPEQALYVGGLNVGHILHNDRREWRAWLMTDEDGDKIGWYATEQEAKDALVDAAVKELCK